MLEGVDLIQAARIVKSNGTDGEILMSFRDILPADIDIHEPVFIYSDGLPVPFFIENLVRRGNDKALVRLNDIRCRTACLCQCCLLRGCDGRRRRGFFNVGGMEAL